VSSGTLNLCSLTHSLSSSLMTLFLVIVVNQPASITERNAVLVSMSDYGILWLPNWYTVKFRSGCKSFNKCIIDVDVVIVFAALIQSAICKGCWWGRCLLSRVIGLYVSLVLVVGRFVRMWLQGLSFRIMFVELPMPDFLLKLCLDIYLVRECGELRVEEELFSQLLFLYRSPETLVKVTKQKVDWESSISDHMCLNFDMCVNFSQMFLMCLCK